MTTETEADGDIYARALAFQASLNGGIAPLCLSWRAEEDHYEIDETANLNLGRAYSMVYIVHGRDVKEIPDEVLKVWDGVSKGVLVDEVKKLKKRPVSVCKLVEGTSAKCHCEAKICEWIPFEKERLGSLKGGDGRSRLQEIAERIPVWIGQHHFKTTEDTERLYHYNHGVYLDNGEAILKAIIEAEFPDITTDTLVRDVIGKVKRRTYIKRDLFNNGHILNVKNGIIDLDTLELRPHSSDYLSTAQINVSYNGDAKATRIQQFFAEVARPKDVPLIEEVIGWLLWPDYNIHKSLMLLGQGRNGKGTLLRLITAFLDKANISNVSLQDLVADRFAKADLYGKLANIGGDLPSKDLSDTASFRMLTGEDDNRAQEKYKAAFAFRNKAKLLFSANVLPRSPDDTYAFYSRWIILEFLNTFDVQKGTGDPNLLDKLTTEEELSGLLNIALAGLARLRSNAWRFSYDKTVEDVEIMYKRNANPVLAFLLDECEERPDSYIEKNVLLSRFKEYARSHGLRPLSATRFSELLKDQTEIPVSTFRPWIEHGDRPMCWLGVRFKVRTNEQSRQSIVFPYPSLAGEEKREEEKREEIEKVGYTGTIDCLDCLEIRTKDQSRPSRVESNFSEAYLDDSLACRRFKKALAAGITDPIALSSICGLPVCLVAKFPGVNSIAAARILAQLEAHRREQHFSQKAEQHGRAKEA